MSADKLVSLGLAEAPSHVKIDVDGIEHLILSGATETLKQVKSVLIEINPNFLEQKNKMHRVADVSRSDLQNSTVGCGN